MNQRYEIQGRIVERRDGVILRDEARRAGRDSIDAAREVAATYLADGLVTWIYTVRWEPGRTTPTYTKVDCRRPTDVRPSRRTPSPHAAVGAQQERQAG